MSLQDGALLINSLFIFRSVSADGILIKKKKKKRKKSNYMLIIIKELFSVCIKSF